MENLLVGPSIAGRRVARLDPAIVPALQMCKTDPLGASRRQIYFSARFASVPAQTDRDGRGASASSRHDEKRT